MITVRTDITVKFLLLIELLYKVTHFYKKKYKTIKISYILCLCAPATIDLTSPSITAVSTSGLILSYHTDQEGTIGHATPAKAAGGTYPQENYEKFFAGLNRTQLQFNCLLG
jgi:hypothetical protein